MLSHNGEDFCCYSAECQRDIAKTRQLKGTDFSVLLNDTQSECKRVVLIGHNSKTEEIMDCYKAYIACQTRSQKSSTLKVTVIDDSDSVKRMDDYRRYPFVEEVSELDIYHIDKTFEPIDRLFADTSEEISILILSDDTELDEYADSSALLYLVYIQDYLKKMFKKNPDYDRQRLNMIVEITDPRHYDIVRGYHRVDAVISNRFTGNIITQIGEKEAIYDFYKDLLSYSSEQGVPCRKPQLRKVSSFFRETPPPCSAHDLVRAVFEASSAEGSEKRYPILVLGYVKADGETVVFSGDLSEINVSLEAEDKIIVYTNFA